MMSIKAALNDSDRRLVIEIDCGLTETELRGLKKIASDEGLRPEDFVECFCSSHVLEELCKLSVSLV